MNRAPVRVVLPVAPVALVITPAESQFLTRFRTLSPDALRTAMAVFESMFEYCQEERMKARPPLSLIQGGAQ